MTDPADLRAELGPTETMAAWHRYLRWAVSYGLPGDGKRYVGMAWTCAAPGLPHPTPGVGHSAPWSPSWPKRVPIRDLRCRALTHAKLDDIGVPRFDDITESGWVPVGVYSPPARSRVKSAAALGGDGRRSARPPHLRPRSEWADGMTETAVLRAELVQALADLEHLRQLVAERRASGAALCTAEYRVAGLRRRLADLATDRPATSDHPADPPVTGRGGGHAS